MMSPPHHMTFTLVTLGLGIADGVVGLFIIITYVGVILSKPFVSFNGVFPKWNRNSMNSAHSGYLINH